jgi:predicted transposase YbfD/YdcC
MSGRRTHQLFLTARPHHTTLPAFRSRSSVTPSEIARSILEQKAEYVLTVKRNQGKLHDDIRHLFEVDRKTDSKKLHLIMLRQ